MEKMPWLSWQEHPVQRSFDPFQFFSVEDHGVFWRGMKATYPILVPNEHVNAATLCYQRQIMFQGRIYDLLPSVTNKEIVEFTMKQNRKRKCHVQICHFNFQIFDKKVNLYCAYCM